MTGVDATGELVAVWTRTGARTTASPVRTSMHAAILEDLPRDPLDSQIVHMPGFVRYRIGQPHPLRAGEVYLHHLDPTP